ncbi:spectrin beta chain, non-erythrocytic 1-like isoform X1 [Argiope bruennichi]|uniref:spectrin beta chain, non-erythrocytic 1-like isoform X1 n=1 Tax=Argiope bruennichi TaxID=94029 RepID=UPI002494C9C5|nr:spectrin beta chain, non-erythrocytic 1-like isoform X1 [Argiope bruennichi]
MSVDQPEAVVENLRQERLNVQKKTFTKWANVHLQKHSLFIDDLFVDLGDGVKLMRLLESLTGEKLGKPAKGSARINKIENVSRCLAFLHSKKMRLENISSEDIVDGKPHLILGLLWTIILRCEIWQHQQNVNNLEEQRPFIPQPQDQTHYPVQKIAKDSLLLWCQTKTDGYPNVRVRDFHRSWRDGLAFNALIHSHVPTLIDYNSLKPQERRYNLENAFTTASKHIGVPKLLDPEDVDTDNPDEKSIIIYVSTLSKGLANVKKGMTGGKRITNVLLKMMEIDDMKEQYNKEATELLEWINSKVDEFKYMEPLTSLEDIQQEIQNFKDYRTEEKPIRNDQKNEIEALLFAIQMKRMGKQGWIPPDETSPAEIERAWNNLERAEHEHETKVRNQLIEQERLENLAYKFESKKAVRENYLKEMLKILTDPTYGTNIKQVDATFKKHEAIRTGIVAREAFIKDLFKVADTLIDSNYRKKDEIIEWKKEMEQKWDYILRLLEAYDDKFSQLRQVINMLEEMDSILEEMNQMQVELDAESEILDVEAGLQNQAVKEVQIASWGEAIRRLEVKIESHGKTKDVTVLQNQLIKLRQTHQSLLDASASRRESLEELLKRNQQLEHIEEMMAWIHEKKLYCDSDINCKDLQGALNLQKKHKSLGSDLKLKKELSEEIKDPRLTKALDALEESYKTKGEKIAFAIQAYQYLADADEGDSWISEKLHILSSLDCGFDELTCKALLRRHANIQREISTNVSEIQRLRQEANKICNVSYEKPPYFDKSTALASPMKTSQPHFNILEEDSRSQTLTKAQIYDRQAQIESSFSELQRKCEERRQRLQHNCMFFRFKNGCEEMEKWMRMKERIINTNDFGKDADEVEKCFEGFITDLASHGLVIEQLKTLCETLEDENSEHAQTARILFDDVYRRWQHLHDITSFKEKNLKGFTSLLVSHRICDDTINWLKEKCEKENYEVVDEIDSIDTLRRKQEAIDRELIPAEERVKQAHVLAENVISSYPDQSEKMINRIRALDQQWENFQERISERKLELEESAGLKMFETSVNSLVEWTNMMVRKLNVREKISDMGVAESVVKEHKELGDEISSQDERFEEIEQLGANVVRKHKDVGSLLRELQEARETVCNLWREKQDWLQQSLDLLQFNREADQLNSLCTSQDTLLESADLGDTLSDVEILLRHHDAFTETLKAQENRFKTFQQTAEALISSGHSESEYIQVKCQQVLEHRENTKKKAEMHKQRLLDEYEFQEFRADAQEMSAWITEKNKLATDLSHQDSTSNLLYKMKRQKTLEAEISANEERLRDTCSRGQAILNKESNSRYDSVETILEDLSRAWNTLCDVLESNQQTLKHAIELRDFCRSVENVLKKLDDISRAANSSNFGRDLRSVKSLIKDLEVLEMEKEMVKSKVLSLINQGEDLMEMNPGEVTVRKLIEEMHQKSEAVEYPVSERRAKLETCLRFHQFKSDVDRELMWISEQRTALSTTTTCRNLLEAQKFQKKIENLELSIESHKSIIEILQKRVLTLVTEEECPVDVTQPCTKMQEEWTNLLREFNSQKEKASNALKSQTFFSEATEIDAWITEKMEILSNTDYGKDEDAVIKLLTKHKALELEIDSYQGLVDELANQAEALIESNHPDSKIISNRMEVVNQEMKNIQKLCSVKRQKLLESKDKHEFEKETEELKIWISEQMAEATSEDFGEDYEHVLILNQNFEFFRAKVEAGSKRILQYEDFAKRLINSNCYFVKDVQAGLEFLSARWSELVESIEVRAFKMEAAAEIHRYHRDVTDLLSRIHSHYRIIPQDLGNNLIHVQDLIKKHDNIENELLGLEAQVHLLLQDSQRLQEAYPGGNEEHIQMQLALVIENWNLLQQKVSSRKVQLLTAQRIHKFISTVREEEIWAKEICLELQSELIVRDVQQVENDFKILGVDIETHLGRFEKLAEEGNSLLEFDIFKSQIEEKLKSLSNIETRVRETWERRSKSVQQKKDTFLFFHEAKQIQISLAQREVQLCGSERKETVEDIENALKKHQEFKKNMDIQEEKFMNWKQQGENILKQGTDEAEKIVKKIQDLSERKKRLAEFSSERTRALTEALQQAKFKRDTIEAEAWIQDKKTKLRHVLKDYHKLSDEEKIKCLQKQLAVQAELDAHEPFINNLVQQSHNFPADSEMQTRVQLILEDWEEVKSNAAQIGNDLSQARDMLRIHDLFEKTEVWIKEKELMIQANEVGKDYEHCMTLQNKLDDVYSDKKIGTEGFLREMQELAYKLSRNEDQKGVYIRYERIWERWNLLKEEIQLYRKKLKDAAQVHSFVKDVDDTIERIREKNLVLSTREEATELSVVQVMQRKLESVERDLTALDDKIKEQEKEALKLAAIHELSAGRIMDKMDHVHRERNALEEELKAKKEYMDTAYTSLKFIKDVNDFANIVHEMVTEIEFGEVPSNSTDAQSLLRAHDDFKPQIELRQKEIKSLQESGQKIIRLRGVHTRSIEESLKTLEDLHNDLEMVWEYRLKTLLQSRDLQLFVEKAKQVENWLSAKEAFLANQDIGDSMSSVEALIRKHENFEEICFTNFEKIREVEMMALDLKDHEDYEVIQSRCEEICRRRDALQEASERRKNTLQDAKALQQLLLEMYEISNWMSEKIRVASDDSYKDLTNLLSKTQKHAAFEAEILANHSRVVSFKQQAEKLIEENHFAAVEIQEHIENLENLWEDLMNETNFKKDRLREAFDALQFKHKLEDINTWLEETEAQIESQEYDSHASALQMEISKVQELQKEAEEYADNLRLLNDIAEEFQQKNHFSKEEIASQLKNTMQRYRLVEDTLQQQESKLEESLLVTRIDNDINDELSWIEGNIKICETDQRYDDVMSVQALQKKLQALETEMASREPLISSVIERGYRSNNEATAVKVQHLEERFQYLKDAISLRRLRLADALEAQKYYFEATQAEMWMKEKLNQVVGCEPERDIYSVQALQKKLSAVEAASDGFRQSIDMLENLSLNLIERGHFDAENIQKKQDEVNDLYEELRQNILKKTAILREKEDYFVFERDVKGLISQLKAMLNVSSSMDHGRDVEHVEALLQKLEVFDNRFHNHEATLILLQDRGNTLIEERHTESENVDELLKELQATWEKLKESAESRHKVLEQEKSVQAFYKSVDETVSWIHEKDVALSSEDYGKDLESIKTLLRHHDTIEGDLKAIEEQVQALCEEASNLAIQFPDSKEDIEAKQQAVMSSWKKCTEKAANRKDRLQQAEQLQSYFDEARDFHAWIYEISALITSTELPEDVATCEDLMAQHEGYKSEIEARFRSFDLFEARGKEIIASGHFLSQDIQTKVDGLRSSLNDLLGTWDTRRSIYEQTMDLLLFKKKLIELEMWLNTQEHNLAEENGRSVEEVEYLIQKHEQFEKKIELYEAKFRELESSTKLEEDDRKRREEEEKMRLENERNLEQQKLEEIRRREEERLLEERRMERKPTEVSQIEDSDDDYRDTTPSGFKRIGSVRASMRSNRLSYHEPDAKTPINKPVTPVITGKKLNEYQKPPSVPPTRAEGFLNRKHELDSGGKRASSRQWKTLYTVLCGQLLCFFKDKKAFLESHSAKPPVNILKARCYIPKDYHKKKYIFRLELSDNSAFLFEAQNDIKRDEWMQKINFTANLPPSKQLLSPNEESEYATPKKEKYQAVIAEEETYSTIGDKSFESSSENYKFPEPSNGHHDRTSSHTYENYKFPEVMDEHQDKTPTNQSVFKTTSVTEGNDPFHSRTMEDIYGEPSIYDDPFEDNGRSFSITSFDENPKSNRSSLSNQSSYVTAAASQSSISTLQDDRMGEVESSDEDYAYASTTPRGSYVMPNPTPRTSYAEESTTPRGSFSEFEGKNHDKVKKHQSLTLPHLNTEELFKKVTKKEPKKKRRFFSLRRN